MPNMTVIKTQSDKEQDADKSMPITIEATTKFARQNYNSSLGRNRCLVCYKLVRNLKGNRLSQYYNINSLTNDSDNFLRAGFGQFERTNRRQASSSSSNLVNTNAKRTIEDMIGQILSGVDATSPEHNSVENLLGENAAHLRKVCESCLSQICQIDFHVRNAHTLADQIRLRIKKSNKLIGSAHCKLRTMSVDRCTAIRNEESSQNVQFVFNKSNRAGGESDGQSGSIKRKAELDSELNPLKMAKQETLKMPTSRPIQDSPKNKFVSSDLTRVNTNSASALQRCNKTSPIKMNGFVTAAEQFKRNRPVEEHSSFKKIASSPSNKSSQSKITSSNHIQVSWLLFD